jgi:hypothetical protein
MTLTVKSSTILAGYRWMLELFVVAIIFLGNAVTGQNA